MREKPFAIAIKRSKWLFVYLIIIHAVMFVTVISLMSNIGFTLITVVAISASFAFYCRRYQWLKSGRAIINIERDDKGSWRIRYFDGSSLENLCLKHCVVIPNLIILNWSGTSFWQTKSVTITADAVDAELFRQLRVYCRDPKLFQR